MEIESVFSREELLQYLLDETDAELRHKINESTRTDSGVRSLFELLKASKERLNFRREEIDQNYKPLRIAEKRELMLRVYSGDLAPNDSRLLLNELNCNMSTLFEDLVSDMTAVSETSVPLLERTPILARLLGRPRVLLKTAALEAVMAETQRPVPHHSWKAKIHERFLSAFESPTPVLVRLGITFVAILLILGSYFAVRHYQTDYKVTRAAELLQENYRVFYQDTPRLSGDYGSTGILELMDPDESELSYLERAQVLIDEAVDKGADSPQAKHVQAQIFFMREEHSKADSLLNLLGSELGSAAAIRNDLGVLYSTQKRWGQAAEQFELAIRADSTFKEAYYNMALARLKLGDEEIADAYLSDYLRLEKDEGWRNAALNLRRKMKQR